MARPGGQGAHSEDALREAGLHIEGDPQLWELTNQKMIGDDGKEFLSPISASDRRLCKHAIGSDPMKKKEEPAPQEKDLWDDRSP